MLRVFALLLVALALAGCQHVPPEVATGCVIPAYPLTFSTAPGILQSDTARIAVGLPAAPPGPPRTFGDIVSDTVNGGDLDRLRPMAIQAHRQVLVLSGGSQHGAFGAGFFAGLKTVPDYEIVTAVSTGALQSTFVFLANRAEPAAPGDPGRRTFQPYMSQAPAIARPGETNLDDLELAYAIQRESDIMKVSKLGYVGAALNGSIATFTPLKAMLTGLISDQTLVEVAEEAKAGRRLFVGVANLDNGKGYALDMTGMVLAAYNVDPADPQPAVDKVRGCYVDALIASASVPPGVPLVSLTVDEDPTHSHPVGPPHMFMDGGALFGVFFQQVHDGAATPRTKGKAPTPTDITLIVNGTLYGQPWTDSKGQPVKKWSVVNFGLRAVDLLQTQVYRFSVDDIEKWALPNGTLQMAFISNENLPGADLPDNHPFKNSLGVIKTCGAFRDDDKEKNHPQEFDAQYMQCLIDYGRSRGMAANPWNHVVPQTSVPTP